MEIDKWGERERETKRRQPRSGEARGAARPGHSRRTREHGGRAPGAAPAPRPALDPPALARPRISFACSAGRGNSYQEMETAGESGNRSGRNGAPWPPRAAPTSPAPAPGGARRQRLSPVPRAAGRAGVKLTAGGAALPLWPKPLEAGRPRAGPGRTYRAAGRVAHPPVPAELSAGRGDGRPGGPGTLGKAAGRADGGPARLGWAARRAVCGPGQARGAGERRASGSDVRGVSAPNRERGRGQRREGREQERAGGRARPLPPGAQEGAPRPPGAPAPPPRPPASPGPAFGADPTAWRGCRGCPAGAPGPEQSAGCLRSYESALRRVSLAPTSLRLTFPETGLPGRARPRGGKDGGVPLGGQQAPQSRP